MKFKRLEQRFCTHIPEFLEPGVLYVSVEYATAAHSCCCGCGEEVMTPFTPTDWKLIFNGQTISLWPSIGNWMLPCRSHYVVREGAVIESRSWTNEEIEQEIRRDRVAKAHFYGSTTTSEIGNEETLDGYNRSIRTSWWRRVWNCASNR